MILLFKSSKLAKEGLSQLKQISQNAKLLEFKTPMVVSAGFVLPHISHPSEYSGFIFQLLVRRKKNKQEYDILASGGRYDKLVSDL